MNRAIEDLLHEHEAILFALKILDSMNRRLIEGKAVDPKDLSGFIDFLKEFADKCHHGKEEGLLFPALMHTGMPEAQHEIEMLNKEHEKGRILIRDMSGAIVPVLNAKQFLEAAESYAALLILHITKENATLFPMAERILTADQLESLFEQFEEHESNVIGPGRHEELHAMLKSWKVKYAEA